MFSFKGWPSLWVDFFDQELFTLTKSLYPKLPGAHIESFIRHPKAKTALCSLSDYFIEGNLRKSYFSDPKFASSYLLYYLPLHASKILKVFLQHAPSFSGPKLEFWDWGAGVGSGSLAFLCFAEEHYKLEELTLTLVDVQKKALDIAERVLEAMLPKVSFRVKIQKRILPLEKCRDVAKHPKLILCAHTLIESSPTPSFWNSWIQKEDLGICFVDIAHKKSSKKIIAIREEILKNPNIGIQAPCLHHGTCPLKNSYHWCYFRIPETLPWAWHQTMSELLGAPKRFLPLSFLWLRAKERQDMLKKKLVVSDPFFQKGKKGVFLCQPERALFTPHAYERGELVSDT